MNNANLTIAHAKHIGPQGVLRRLAATAFEQLLRQLPIVRPGFSSARTAGGLAACF